MQFEGPCEWDAEICENCCAEALGQLDPPMVELIKQWAAGYLWRATGRIFGLCERTYRPCRRECYSRYGLPWPTRVDGQWFNLSCGACPGECGCSTISEVILPDVYSVEAITVDGGPVADPASMVAVYNRRRLVRIDGGTWPACQDLSDPDGPSAWTITVKQGYPVPPGGEIVAGILACELAKACIGDPGCRLPRRVQTITRQDVTVGFQDQFENLAELRVGIWEVDAWMESVRSTRYRQASITSPDVPKPSVLTWPLPVTVP